MTQILAIELIKHPPAHLCAVSEHERLAYRAASKGRVAWLFVRLAAWVQRGAGERALVVKKA